MTECHGFVNCGRHEKTLMLTAAVCQSGGAFLYTRRPTSDAPAPHSRRYFRPLRVPNKKHDPESWGPVFAIVFR